MAATTTMFTKFTSKVMIHRKRTLRTFSSDADLRNRLLEVSLNYAKQDGWCEECIIKASSDLKMPDQSYKILRRGIAEVVQHFYHQKRTHVYGKIGGNCATQVSGDNKLNLQALEEAINVHIDYMIPFRNVLGDAISVGLHPREWPHTMHNLYSNVDDLCHFAGIKSSRLDWYAERFLMSYLYCSTELYFLSDKSPNGNDTREFIKRNIVLYDQLRTAPIFWKFLRFS